jgi:transcriptional regulator with XRE-family HTH domain
MTQKQVADICRISKSQYHAIESGKRIPSIDVLYVLSAIYRTSMNFIYHAYYRQHVIFHFPDNDLKYAKDMEKAIDIQYLRERLEPAAPPEIPAGFVCERPLAADEDFMLFELEAQ